MGTKLATLTVFPTRMEAEMAKQLLEAAGIPSFVSADDAGGMRPAPFAYTCGAELIVNKKRHSKSPRDIKPLMIYASEPIYFTRRLYPPHLVPLESAVLVTAKTIAR